MKFLKDRLIEEYDMNSYSYDKCNERIKTINNNRSDSKILETATVTILLMGLTLIGFHIWGIPSIIYSLVSTMPIQYATLLTTGASYGIGKLITKIYSKLLKREKKLKEATSAKKEIDKLRIEILYKIRREQKLNRNIAINNALKNNEIVEVKQIDIDSDAKQEPSKRDLAEMTLESLEKELETKYKELDILSEKAVLNKEFDIARNFSSQTDLFLNIEMGNIYLLLPLVMPSVFFSNIALTGTPLSSTVMLLAFALFLSLGKVYFFKKIRNYKKVFKLLNDSIDSKNRINKLNDKVKDLEKERNIIKTEIFRKCNEVTNILINIESQKAYIDSIENESQDELEIVKVRHAGLNNTKTSEPVIENNKSLVLKR